MNFSPDGHGPSPGACNGDFETTGTVAVVQAAPEPLGEGFIDTGSPTDYKFRADLKPAFVLQFCKKDASGNCTKFGDVQNDYIGFYIYGGPESEAGKGLHSWKEEARTRCAAHGVDEKTVSQKSRISPSREKVSSCVVADELNKKWD